VTDPGAAMSVVPIGVVSSPLTDPAAAPKQGSEGAPDAWLVLEPGVAAGLDGMRPGDEIIVLTPDRPNPIGLHRVEVAAIDGARVRVRGLEAIDGTPVVDLKPVLRPR
jgi:tRNA (Thr-GGU) A37 N-methylase